MRLLFIVNVDWFFLSHRLPIAIAAIDQGHEVHIATTLTDGQRQLEERGLIVHPLRLDRGSTNIAGLIGAFRQILDVYRHVQPDLVHLVTIKPVLLGGFAARWTGVPAVVAAISGLGSLFVARGVKSAMRRRVVCTLYRIALKQNRMKVIFQNTSDRALLSKSGGLKESQTTVIAGSGVDLEEFAERRQPAGKPVVVLAARLLLDKGVGEFVEAARIIRRQNHGQTDIARFALVGSLDPDNPTSVSASQLEEWIQEGAIEYWGHRDDMSDVLASANIVVLPSYYGEGLPKILIEAAASGRAVVTTDHPGCRDAIEADVTGLLVPVRDAAALARAIRDLLDDPQRCAALGRAGRKLAERDYAVGAVVGEHLKIYRELLSGAQ